ncbi:MAG: hypothetical protein Q9168_008286, partial [Polycauliona sp. 1 TL-2023]
MLKMTTPASAGHRGQHEPVRQTTMEHPLDNGNQEGKQPRPKRVPLPTRLWQKSGLNIGMLAMMFKGALPPTIAIALYQSTAFAIHYSTLGYLVAIMSILSFAIMPRAKFLQTMLFNVIGICFGFCITLLCIYCSVQARKHTTPPMSTGPKSSSGGPSPGASVAPYNSSASAVCAIWLFFNIYFSNTLRANRPQFQFPVIMFSIFATVASTYAPQFATMAQGIAFAQRLVEAFLTGFAIATGVSFLVFPLTSRTVVFKTTTGYIKALSSALKAQSKYLQSLEDKNAFGNPSHLRNATHSGKEQSPSPHDPSDSSLQSTPEATALKTAVATIAELHGKLGGDLAFAKREIAYGKLDASEISELFKLMRQVMLPIIGMTSVADIFDRVAERRGWKIHTDDSAEHQGRSDEVKDMEKEQWSEIMRTLHEPFETLTDWMDQGLQHALFTLELEKKPGKRRDGAAQTKDANTPDLEENGDAIEPGDERFGSILSSRIDQFYEQRKVTLDTWCRQKGMADPENHQRHQRQLYLILYMEFLLWSTGRAVLDLVRFADSKVKAGTMKKKRLVAPGMKRVKKWISAALSTEDSSADHAPDTSETTGFTVQTGDAHRKSKDPEHLPPTNAWQRFGDGIRVIPRILGSQESAFGFRVACATLSIGIVAFLRDTQAFFVQQRLVWAMIMVSIGMTVTAGAGVFGFIGRVSGTFLIVGYELQVRKVGMQVAESSGQPAYPLYQLAPYRLACVSGGMLVAFIWTFFPYPLTARSQLRKDLGASLYLLANYYSCVHTTVGMRLDGSGGDLSDKKCRERRLDKARAQVFTKELALLAGLRQHSAFTKWEPTFGGKFPRQKYDTIIQEVQ